MKNRSYYEKLFETYPSVVALPEYREMLGGIGDTTARKLMRGNHVQHFCLRHTCLIPRAGVIDYVLSKHYRRTTKNIKFKFNMDYPTRLKPFVQQASLEYNFIISRLR